MLMNLINAFNLSVLTVILVIFSRYCYDTLVSYEISGLIIDTREYVCAYILYGYTVAVTIFTGYFIINLF